MDQLAQDFKGDVHFLFIYVREAHPDHFPDHPAHKSIEQKFQHARDLRDRHSSPRPVLVDDLDGTVHREWGGLPNMSWIIDHTGHIAYKAGWTVESDIRAALEDLVRVRELKHEAAESGRPFRPYYKETISVVSSRPRRTEEAPVPTASGGHGA